MQHSWGQKILYYEYHIEIIWMSIKMKINMFKCASRVALWLQKLFPCMRNFGNWLLFPLDLVQAEYCLPEAPYLEVSWHGPVALGCRDSDLRMTLTTIYVFWADPNKFCDPDCIRGSTILQQDKTQVYKMKGLSTFQRVRRKIVMKLAIVVRKLPAVFGEVPQLCTVNCHM